MLGKPTPRASEHTETDTPSLAMCSGTRDIEAHRGWRNDFVCDCFSFATRQPRDVSIATALDIARADIDVGIEDHASAL